MGAAVDAYVSQRVPGPLLDRALAKGVSIEVHGIYPYHVGWVMPEALRLATDRNARPGKIYNSIRPLCFMAPRDDGGMGTRLLVAVPPGRDYVLHYASLVEQYIRRSKAGAATLRKVRRYPDAELSIAVWTGLPHLVAAGDRLLIGYVQQLVPLLCAAGAEVADRAGNAYYEAVRLRFPGGGEVCALGVRFSFWGCLSARLATACQERGVREIIYAGKLGALTDPSDIYTRLFVPSRYARSGSSQGVLGLADTPPNPLLDRYPDMDTGVHMSVGTVLEEDLGLRAYAQSLGTTSMDNEISQIAAGLAAGAGKSRTAFSAIHFATDYLRGAGERVPRGTFNLTNNRHHDARAGRQAMLRQVAELLAGHYNRPLPAFADARDDLAVAADGLAQQNGME